MPRLYWQVMRCLWFQRLPPQVAKGPKGRFLTFHTKKNSIFNYFLSEKYLKNHDKSYFRL